MLFEPRWWDAGRVALNVRSLRADPPAIVGAMPPVPSVFGEIEPHSPGARFDSRKAIRNAGLHRHEQAGISGRYEDGADAIVVSGGYVDDIDEGDVIVYTGQGGRDPNTGRQVRDQRFEGGNLALARSEELACRIHRNSVRPGVDHDERCPDLGR
jgi:hypothetical protein